MTTENMRLLIVDDNKIMRSMIRSVAIHVGDVIRECESGEEAVKVFQEFRPDLVLMDIHMKGMDGITATREIKKLSPSTRVIVVTNFVDSQSRHAALQAGAEDVLSKENLLDIPRSFKGPSGNQPER